MAIQMDPEDVQAYINRGLVKIELKQYPEALIDFDYAIDLDLNNADAYYHADKELRYALQLATQVGNTNLIVRIGQLLQEIESRTVE